MLQSQHIILEIHLDLGYPSLLSTFLLQLKYPESIFCSLSRVGLPSFHHERVQRTRIDVAWSRITTTRGSIIYEESELVGWVGFVCQFHRIPFVHDTNKANKCRLLQCSSFHTRFQVEAQTYSPCQDKHLENVL